MPSSTLKSRAFLSLISFKASMLLLTAIAVLTLTSAAQGKPGEKRLVAHRGASSYAPEHTLEAYTLAIEQGADFVEQDLQVTKDGVLVCLHDITLERTTDVETVFPDRYRLESRAGLSIKHWYVYDFTLTEIKRLDAGAWFSTRFQGARVPSFKEAIDEIRGKAGLYPELKDPEVYTSLGFDVELLLMSALDNAGLWRPGADKRTPLIIQSFSATSLKRLSRELNCKLPLVLLVDQGQGAIWLGPVGMLEAKEFAWGLGPAKNIVDAQVVQRAHAAGLIVTPYTFRSSDTGRFSSVKDEMDFYLYQLGVDGVFTDNPDQFPRAKK